MRGLTENYTYTLIFKVEQSKSLVFLETVSIGLFENDLREN